LALMGVR